MHKFIRLYNQNRAEFIVIFAIIAFFFVIIYVLNGILAKMQEQEKNEISFRNNNVVEDITIISKANESVITGKKIESETSDLNQKIIKEFVQYCNEKKIEEAYNMLSDECKEVFYPTIEDFTSKYYLKIFNTERIYSLENWYDDINSSTYYIKYMEDIMATGKVNSSNNKYEYITIVYTDNGYKLNLNGYIGRNTFSRTIARDNVVIKVNYIDQYTDFTTLNITITNYTKKTICIDSKEDSEMLYIYDENNVKYSAFLTELSEEELKVEANSVKTINIKFSRIYNILTDVKGVVFSDIVMNYDAYEQGIEEKERITIKT